MKPSADVAQLVEQLICNQRVGGSNPLIGSMISVKSQESGKNTMLLKGFLLALNSKLENGEVPEWSKGADCKSAGAAYGGSNPPLSTSKICNANFAVNSYKLKVIGF